jgi:hypothetical protein
VLSRVQLHYRIRFQLGPWRERNSHQLPQEFMSDAARGEWNVLDSSFEEAEAGEEADL